MSKTQDARRKNTLSHKDIYLYETVFKKALEKTVAISVANTDGNIIYVNDKFCKLTGYSKKELIGKNHRIVKSGYHPKTFYEEMWGMITKGKIWSGEIKYRDKEGFFHWKEISIIPVLNSTQKYDYVSIQLDITKYKDLIKNQEEFVNMAAHEIRAPLTVIKAAFENIISGIYGAVPEQITKVAKKIFQDINKTVRMANNILSFSQLKEKKELINSHKIDTIHFFSDLAIRFQPNAKENNIVIVPEVALDLPPICINEDLIIQVVSNLLSNGFRFAKKNILFKTQYKKDGLIYTSISDDGPGIPVEDQKKLFIKFSQIGDRVQRGGYKSTGLGLAICKEIIEDIHKGKIWVESEIDKGTKFIFTLDTQCRCNRLLQHLQVDNKTVPLK